MTQPLADYELSSFTLKESVTLFSRLLTPFTQTVRRIKQREHINAFDITLFLRQFATLVSAGIPIIQGCDILEKSQEKTALRLLIYTIKREVLSGKTLASSLSEHPVYFDALTSQLVQIGEHTGKLELMLSRIAVHQEKQLAFKKRIKQALFYPSLITFTALVVTLGLLLFVIPRFADLFHDMHEKLPALTVAIFYLSAKLQQSVWLLLPGVLLGIVLLWRLYQRGEMKTRLQQGLCRLPFIKLSLRKILLARFARNLAITFAAGLSLTDGLTLTAQACGSPDFALTLYALRRHLLTGKQLHHAMEALPDFPPLMIQMIKIGEESGLLQPMLDKIADFFESDTDQLIGRLNQLLEPLIMIVLGVLIGGLVIGMYLPIFKIGSVL